MRITKLTILKQKILYGLAIATLMGTAMAHDGDNAGQPVCIEGNFMLADAQNEPFASANGMGRVLEVNIFTGTRGVAFDNPYTTENAGTAIVPEGVVAPGPFKPTGVLSGGISGHAFITSAAQHSITEFHRDGTPIRTAKLPMDDDPRFGTVPRLLGSQVMPNGNLIQSVCDANFPNAINSDPNTEGHFPPVWSTPERASNSRLLVLDQETLEVIDEYSAPDDPRWTCMAGIVFSDEGMFVSMFHGAAVFVIDWKAGMEEEKSTGFGSNMELDDDDDDDGHHKKHFRLGKDKNVAKVIRVIDLLEDGDSSTPAPAMDDPRRRDSLRAISLDESGNLYATFRDRATQPNAAGPGGFRQHISIVPTGKNYPTRTLAMDHGVQVIAGIRTNRMSGPGCQAVNPDGTNPEACNVETLYVSASAFNPGGCDGVPGGCFKPGGGVGEYLIKPSDADGPDCRANNNGCAKPIATFLGTANGEENVDPRMLMIIHEAFVQ